MAKVRSQTDVWFEQPPITKQSGFDPFGEDLPSQGFSHAVDKVFRRMLKKLEGELVSLEEAGKAELLRQAKEIVKQATGTAFRAEIAAASRNWIAAGYVSGGELAMLKLRSLRGIDIERIEAAGEAVEAALSKAVDRAVAKLSDGIGKTFNVHLRDMLGEGIQKGEPPRELAKRVREWAGKVGDPHRGTRARSMMIARTESRRAQVDAQVTSWKASEMVEGNEWLLSPNACEFCSMVAKSPPVPIGEPFRDARNNRKLKLGYTLIGTKGGRMKLNYETIYGPTLHPNCRCDLLPVPVKVGK